MANIRIKNLPTDVLPNKNDLIPIDGGTTRNTTIENLVKAGRPFASQADSEVGTNATKAMNPLTTKQSIASEVGVTLASASQGAKADSAVQPGNLAAVATSGAYADLSGKPTLGSASAASVEDFAPIAKGVPSGGTTGQVLAKASNADADAGWIDAGAGDMVGPTGATDGALVRFDGNTGKRVKEAGAIRTDDLADDGVTEEKLSPAVRDMITDARADLMKLPVVTLS